MVMLIPRFQAGPSTVVIRGLRNMDMKSVPKIWDFLNKFVPVNDLDVRSYQISPSCTQSHHPNKVSTTDLTEVWVYTSSEADATRLIETLNRKEGITAISSVDVMMLEEFDRKSVTTPAPPQQDSSQCRKPVEHNNERSAFASSSPAPSIAGSTISTEINTRQQHPSGAARPEKVHIPPTSTVNKNSAQQLDEATSSSQKSNTSNAMKDISSTNDGSTVCIGAQSTIPCPATGNCLNGEVTCVRVMNIPSYANQEWFQDIAITLKLPVATEFSHDVTNKHLTISYSTREAALHACDKLSQFRLGSVSLNALLMDNRSVMINGFVKDSCTDLLLYQLWAPYGAIESVRTCNGSTGCVTFVHATDARNLLALSATSDGFSVLVHDNQEMVLTVSE